MPDPLLSVRSLARTVAGRAIVDAVSLDVATGEVVAIVGASGSGKSSLLRLLNRLDEPTGGRVLLEGRDAATIPPRELRRRLGMVMQMPVMFAGTVGDNIAYGPRQHGETLPRDAIDTLLAGVGLPGFAGRDAARLSGGEAQRVALARTLANDPQMLLLDEPTSALDEETKREVEALLSRLIRHKGLTCLMVTHDPAQAERMAGRRLVMEAGRLRPFASTAPIPSPAATGSQTHPGVAVRHG